MVEKVLVTGGSGFVGKRLRAIRPDWIYPTSRELDLTRWERTFNYLVDEQPDAVVHLAAKVGGIKDNVEHPADFYEQNIRINTNIVQACRETGVKRLLASLSTCAFPDVFKGYPFTEKSIFNGPPAKTNRAYGFTKRALYVHILACRDQDGLDYSCFSPSNLYGPEDHFDLNKSHFLPAAIRKLHEAEQGDEVEFWGTGDPLRQQLYVDDLCRAIPELLEKHHSDDAVIIAPDSQHRIWQMVDLCRDMMNKDVSVRYNGKLDGQYRKDGSNAKFKELCPQFEFTSIEEGLQRTYEWYKESVNNRN
tara:strand:- start:6390 stop:7304 length:915 start_codon:yes stop_codon:yes gene_type:complete